MTVSSEVKLQKMTEAIDQLALLGYRLDKLLIGFKLYNQLKGTMDPEKYEQALEMFAKAINAMEEQMNQYHRLFWELKDLLK